MRYGETAAFEEQPHSPYYGSADATPLFVVLLDEYERWTGDAELVRELEQQARAALDWIDEYGDLTGNGYVSYQRRNAADRPGEPVLEGLLGLASPTATAGCPASPGDLRAAGLRVRRQDARRPAGPRRLERPGVRRPAGAGGRRAQASGSTGTSGSRTASTIALALDADGGQVDALTSNIGHLLWSGIVDESKADAAGART